MPRGSSRQQSWQSLTHSRSPNHFPDTLRRLRLAERLHFQLLRRPCSLLRDGYRIALLFCPEDAINGMRPFRTEDYCLSGELRGWNACAGRRQTVTAGRDHGPCLKAVSELPFDTANFRMAVGFPLIRNACLLG